MKTSKDLAKLAKKINKKEKEEYQNEERKYRETEKKKKEDAIQQAKKDVEKAIIFLETLIKGGHYRKYNDTNKKYYEIKNYNSDYEKELNIYFYDDQDKNYWNELTKLLRAAGFKATLEDTTHELYDSLTTFTYYNVDITL